MLKKYGKKAVLFAVLVCMLISLLPCGAFAEDGTEDEVKIVSATSAKRKTTIDGFKYSDAYFSLDCNEYHQELAQLSSGLIYASSRAKTETNAGDFLEDIGFTDIDLTPYETLPTTDSIANCIGNRQIGDTTVIAVGVCGGDYEKEWASNFTVGDEERSVGFNQAAQQVIARIEDYIEKYSITGKKTLWISGYSRAAATSNIVAADMTDSGIFDKVFAYTFATPRTTRDKGSYTNIFNIISKDDVVPRVPLADWGYERYGVDLYLPAQEFDSNYPTEAYKAYLAVPDSGFTNNTELAGDFRIIFAYLYELVPDAETYVSLMQDNLRDIIASGSTDDALNILALIVEEIVPETEEQAEEQQAFLSYMDEMIARYVLYGNRAQIDKNEWLVQKGIAKNLILEHDMSTYISWMLSSETGEGLYSDQLSFLHLTLNTDADVMIYQDNELVQTILYDGTCDYTGTGYTEDDIYIAYTRNGMQVGIDLPLDRVYDVMYIPDNDEDGDMVAVQYNVNTAVPETVVSVKLNAAAGVPCIVRSEGDGELQLVTGGTDETSSLMPGTVPMSVVTTLENINVFNLSVYELVYVWVITTGILQAELVIILVLTIYRRVRHKKRSEIFAAILFLANMVLLTMFEILVWYFAPSLPYINEIAAFICYAIMFGYAAGGKNKWLLLPLGLVQVGLLILSWFEVDTLTYAGMLSVVIRQIILTTAAWLIRHGVRRRAKMKKAEAE